MHSYDDEIWNEFEWETHIKQMEDQNKQLRAFFENGSTPAKPRWAQLMDEYGSRIEAINAYIEEELLIEESYFPDDEDLDDDDDDLDDPFFGFDFDDQENDEEFDDELFFEDDDLDDELDEWDDEGEEWKNSSDEFIMSDYGSIEHLPVYIEARSLGAELLEQGASDKEFINSAEIREFITHTLQIAAKIAAGYSFGFEKEVLGANIAYSKKALSAANLALQKWQNIKNKKLITHQYYLEIHTQLFELRNDIGVYIQDLREQFHKI